MKAQIHSIQKNKQEITAAVVDNSNAKVELFEVQGDGGFDQFYNLDNEEVKYPTKTKLKPFSYIKKFNKKA